MKWLTEMIATTNRLKTNLRVFGKDLTKAIHTGALLAEGFAFVSLIHTDSPLQRAASDTASIALVLLDEPCTLEEASAVVAHNLATFFVLDGCIEPELECLGATTVSFDDTALLQAVVASARAQSAL